MDEYESLENLLNELDESPFGPVEFGATVFADEKSVHIQHFRVHEEYREQGHGTERLSEALEIIQESSAEITEVSINLIEEGGSTEFLESFGFEDVTVHQEGEKQIVSGVLKNIDCD